jgi:hypothetical protein
MTAASFQTVRPSTTASQAIEFVGEALLQFEAYCDGYSAGRDDRRTERQLTGGWTLSRDTTGLKVPYPADLPEGHIRACWAAGFKDGKSGRRKEASFRQVAIDYIADKPNNIPRTHYWTGEVRKARKGELRWDWTCWILPKGQVTEEPTPETIFDYPILVPRVP